MTWLQEHAQEIANCIWNRIPEKACNEGVGVRVGDICEHGVKFVFIMPGSIGTNTVAIAGQGKIVATEDADIVAELVVLMAEAQTGAFHMGQASQD